MAKNEIQVNFRMPEELKANLETCAKNNGRSLTSEIVRRLENSFFQVAAKTTLDEIALDMNQRLMDMPLVRDMGDLDQVLERYEQMKAQEAANVRELSKLADALVRKRLNPVEPVPESDDKGTLFEIFSQPPEIGTKK